MRATQTIDLTFESDEIRMVMDSNSRPMWVATDLLPVLGLSGVANDHTKRIPKRDKGKVSIPTLGGPQEMICVYEAGLYRLVFKSKKPEAEKFQNFIFHEVIPSLHRHGCYPPPKEDQEILDQPHRPNHFDAVAAHCYRLGDLSLEYANNISEHEKRQNKIVQEFIALERELGIHLPLECDKKGKARNWDAFNPVVVMGHIPTRNAGNLN